MVGTRVVATPDPKAATAAHKGGHSIGVALFHQGTEALPGLGGALAHHVRRGLPAPPSDAAWDFLSIAMSVFAADRFILRSEAADDWVRVIALNIAVSDPARWRPLADRLSKTLRFLTGDIWTVTFSSGGAKAPKFQSKFTDRDAVCLFSGGLDSLLGTLKLLDDGRKPLLVSQGSMKEVGPQTYLAQQIGMTAHRFDGRIREKWCDPYEGSTRSRSILFIAYGMLAATALNLPEVIIPENGLIAINPPMTLRRLGSLSTRTAHPHFLGQLEGILHDAGLKIRLTNIFEGQTKGQMLAQSKHSSIQLLASATYSCGKGKRKNGQCGHCVPCLIRRASFDAAGVTDKTPYVDDIRYQRTNDDVAAARIAIARRKGQSAEEFERWVAAAGPLPQDGKRRAKILKAVSDGLGEVDAFLSGIKWKS